MASRPFSRLGRRECGRGLVQQRAGRDARACATRQPLDWVAVRSFGACAPSLPLLWEYVLRTSSSGSLPAPAACTRGLSSTSGSTEACPLWRIMTMQALSWACYARYTAAMQRARRGMTTWWPQAEGRWTCASLRRSWRRSPLLLFGFSPVGLLELPLGLLACFCSPSAQTMACCERPLARPRDAPSRVWGRSLQTTATCTYRCLMAKENDRRWWPIGATPTAQCRGPEQHRHRRHS